MFVGLLFRFAWALRPLASDFASYYVWCSPRSGVAGFHAVSEGRCPTCKRRVRTTKGAP